MYLLRYYTLVASTEYDNWRKIITRAVLPDPEEHAAEPSCTGRSVVGVWSDQCLVWLYTPGNFMFPATNAQYMTVRRHVPQDQGGRPEL